MHNLLKRQLRKYFTESLQIPAEWRKFVEAVNDAYTQSDIDRGMLERSLDLSSQELLHTNSEMMGLISLLNSTIDSTADGILVVNRQGKIVRFNQKFIEMWDIPRQILESRDDDQALSFVLAQLKDPEGFLKKVRELYANPEAESYDELKFKDGRVFERFSQPQRIGEKVVGRVWNFRNVTDRRRAEEALLKAHEKLEIRVQERTAELANANLLLRQEITERKQMEERINYLAYYDNLTGLPNRNLFIDRLTQGIARADYNKRIIAVLVIDIDRFKFINDTYGLDVGDKVLKELAGTLLTSVREGDTISRLGSDEFGIALIDIAHSEDIILVVEKIMRNASQTINFNGKEIVLTLSIGVSVYPDDGKDTNELMRNADLAILKAKQQGRKNYRFYTEDMNVKALEFVLMEKHLFNALKNDEFILYYQPYWDINTRKIRGVEALIRWQSRDFGLVSPAKFIPVLEETGMIIEVGEWVFKTACRQVMEWYRKGCPVIPVSVNLSSGPIMSPASAIPGYPVVPVSVNLSLVQFRQKDLAEMLERVITEAGIDPGILTMEITESTFMHDVEFTSSVLKKIKDIGISISVDDFGTGYSSLSYLKRLPIDNLKIDISFIRDIATDPDAASIVTAIISMAHTLNLKTIAEGIETEEQLKILRLLRCDLGQGYYFSPPLPAEEVEKFLIYQK